MEFDEFVLAFAYWFFIGLLFGLLLFLLGLGTFLVFQCLCFCVSDCREILQRRDPEDQGNGLQLRHLES